MVKDYLTLRSKKWEPGSPHLINKLSWGIPELLQIEEVLDSDWFGGNSKYNQSFEEKLEEFSGLKHFQTVNSGSAAIEIAVQTLIQNGVWKRGSLIIHPRLSFPTSISSAISAGLVPVYVDVGLGTYVLDEKRLWEAFEHYNSRIDGAIIPALLGNVPNLDVLLELLDGRPLIIDSCDVMGSKWDKKEVASYATLAAYSFYGSHHISTFGVGGAVGTNNDKYYETIKSLTFWGRDQTKYSDAFDDFINRYSYTTYGLDAQMSAVQAAFGLAQINRLSEYISKRQWTFKALSIMFEEYQDWFYLPHAVSPKADVSWFCYPLLLTDKAPFKRDEFVRYLVEHKVEIRPIFCDIVAQKWMLNHTYLKFGGENTDYIVNNGFFISAAPMENEQLENYMETVDGFLRTFKNE